MEEMTQAEDEYHAKGQGSLGFVRKGLRKVGDYAPAINPWFDLIPEGDGFKILSSGLKLVFNVLMPFHVLSDRELTYDLDCEATSGTSRENPHSVPRLCYDPW